MVVFQEINCLCSSGHRASSLFMFVSAVVSEIHELKKEKEKGKEKNFEIDYFHLSWASNLPIF